jgi:hypothetical protein
VIDPAALASLRARWAAEGAEVPAGVTGEAFAAFETRHGVRLPADMRSFYTAMDGNGPWYTVDDHGVCFWPLERVRPLSDEQPEAAAPGDERLFVFADLLIWSHAWAVRLEPGAPAAVLRVGDNAHEEIAPSFGAFVERYARDPRLAI